MPSTKLILRKKGCQPRIMAFSRTIWVNDTSELVNWLLTETIWLLIESVDSGFYACMDLVDTTKVGLKQEQIMHLKCLFNKISQFYSCFLL